MCHTKYASAVPKNLGVGVDFWPCSAVKAISSPGVRSPWWKLFKGGHYSTILAPSKPTLDIRLLLNVIVLFTNCRDISLTNCKIRENTE